MKKNTLLLLFTFICFTSFSQVGIGTTDPDATLHIKGTTVLPSGGGLSTLYSNDFSTGGVTYNANAGNTCTTGSDVWNIAATSFAGCSPCTGNRANVTFSSSCAQNLTLIEGNFTPTTTSMDISFNYHYVDFSVNDSFIVTLYNETTSTVTSTLLSLTSTAQTSFSSSETVIIGNNYSLRFQYIGDDDYGAAVDDILVQETTSGSGGAYTFKIEDGQQQNGYVMTSDADGNATWKVPTGPPGSGDPDQTLSISGSDLTISGTGGNTVTIPSSGGAYTFGNGLTDTSGTVKLGGSLTDANTTINIGANNLIFSSTNASGNFIVNGSSDTMMTTNHDKDYVSFGESSGTPDTDVDDITFSIGGTSYTSKVVLGYYRGDTGGSGFRMGSVEYMIDGGAELFLDGASALSPLFNTFSFADLGTTDAIINPMRTTTGEWEDIYVQNTVTVSDLRTKNNVKKLNYGLNEVLKLKPVSFDYIRQLDMQKQHNVPQNLRKQKLGFVAQDLLNVLPEVVKTHDWKVTDEKTKRVEYLENHRYGVMYSDIVPVTVRAIQEQQEQIEVLKTAVEELKKQNELLMQLIKEKK